MGILVSTPDSSSPGPGLPGVKNGGRVPKTGVYKLHKGEIVIPSRTANTLSKRAPRKVKKPRAKPVKRRRAKKR